MTPNPSPVPASAPNPAPNPAPDRAPAPAPAPVHLISDLAFFTSTSSPRLRRHCRWISNLAFASFYVGSGSVWGAVVVFFFALFDDASMGAVYVFVGICSTALFASLVLVVTVLQEPISARIEVPPTVGGLPAAAGGGGAAWRGRGGP